MAATIDRNQGSSGTRRKMPQGSGSKGQRRSDHPKQRHSRRPCRCAGGRNRTTSGQRGQQLMPDSRASIDGRARHPQPVASPFWDPGANRSLFNHVRETLSSGNTPEEAAERKTVHGDYCRHQKDADALTRLKVAIWVGRSPWETFVENFVERKAALLGQSSEK